MRPRVFVSSVMDGFSEFREAARQAIGAVGGEAVLVEDYPSLLVSSRTACLDGVASADALLVIVGQRGGWRAPSGQLVVEEEFEEARRRSKPVVLLIQEGPHDEDAQALLRKLSDYVDGLFRKTFVTADELNREVQSALAPQLAFLQEPMMDTSFITAKITERGDRQRQGNETNLRFVLAPERQDELVGLVDIGGVTFKNEIYELGSAASVQLFSHERAKQAAVKIDTLVVTQTSPNTNWQREGVDNVLLELSYQGAITIDVNVTGREAAQLHSFAHAVILERDIEAGLRRCLAFANAFYNRRDPFKRYSRFFINAALSNLNYRTLRAEPVVGNSMTMSSRNQVNVAAYDAPRLLNRGQLESPVEPVQNMLTMFRRRLEPAH